MQSVTDQFGRHMCLIAGRADHTRFPVVKLRHGVKQVGHMGSPGIKRPARLFVRCIRMCQRYTAVRSYPAYKQLRSRELRCNIHDTDPVSAGLLKSEKFIGVRQLQESTVLCALFLFRKIRTLHMDSESPGSVRGAVQSICGCCSICICQLFERKSHGCR